MRGRIVFFLWTIVMAAGAQPAVSPCFLAERQLSLECSERCLEKIYARDSTAQIIAGDIDNELRPWFDEVLIQQKKHTGDTVILNAHRIQFECTGSEPMTSARMTIAFDAANLTRRRGWSDTITRSIPSAMEASADAPKGFPYDIVIFSAAAVAITALFFFVRSQ